MSSCKIFRKNKLSEERFFVKNSHSERKLREKFDKKNRKEFLSKIYTETAGVFSGKKESKMDFLKDAPKESLQKIGINFPMVQPEELFYSILF